jgi:hypothetical protein
MFIHILPHFHLKIPQLNAIQIMGHRYNITRTGSSGSTELSAHHMPGVIVGISLLSHHSPRCFSRTRARVQVCRLNGSLHLNDSSIRVYGTENFTCIMRPDGEGPGVVADEVGAVVRDAEVVNYLPRTGVVYLAEGNTVTQQREEAISGSRAIRRGSA